MPARAARLLRTDTRLHRRSRLRARSRPNRGAVIEHAGARRAPPEDGQPPWRPVRRQDKALVSHQVREVKRLSALAGAGVPPGFAGLRRAGVADELRREVLDLEGPRLE